MARSFELLNRRPSMGPLARRLHATARPGPSAGVRWGLPGLAGLMSLMGGLLAPVTAQGQTPAARPARTAIGCLISPDRVADIGAQVVGVVASLPVEVGDRVRSGQTLAALRSDVEGANLQAAQVRSSIDAEVRAAEASLALARQRLERAEGLQAEGFVSPQASDQARAEHQVALHKLQQARGQLRVSAGETGIAQAQLSQRRVSAPFDGVVIERYVNAGERVEDKPLLRLARLDPLRVELVVPAHRYGSVAMNEAITVTPELPGVAALQARVTHIDPVIDAASNTFRVRLRLPNPGHTLPGGARCQVTLAGTGDVAAAGPAAVPQRLASPTMAPRATPSAPGVQPASLRVAPAPAPALAVTLPGAASRGGPALKLSL